MSTFQLLLRTTQGHSTCLDKSHSQHKVEDKWTPPTELLYDMDFEGWLKIAEDADLKKVTNASAHYYYMTGSEARDGRSFIAQDLNIFAAFKENFFVTNVRIGLFFLYVKIDFYF